LLRRRGWWWGPSGAGIVGGRGTATATAEAVGGIAKGDAFVLHGPVGAEGDANSGDQAEEETELPGHVHLDPGHLADTGRIDDPVEDEKHGEAAEHGDDDAHRHDRLEVSVGETYDDQRQCRYDRGDEDDRDEVERVPGVPGAEIAREATDAGDLDTEPIEEHECEEQDRRDPDDLLPSAQPVYCHLHIPP
jgi:hypothetical protein